MLLVVISFSIILTSGQLAFAGFSLTPTSSGFYGSDNAGNIFLFDPAIPLVTFLGNTRTNIGSTEIECDDFGICFLQGSDGIFRIAHVVLDVPAPSGFRVFDGGAFNGLEYVGTTLYGTSIVNPCFPSILSTLNPFSGVSAIIGPTNTGRPMSGLAFDQANGIMYGVDGCGALGPSNLYTVDLTTGLATPIGNTKVTLGSLEFGPDGQLYAGGDRRNGGNLYQIDTATGAATFVIRSGFPAVTGLTLVQSLTLEVEIDIKPGSDPNCIKTTNKGFVPVSILGSVDFDVTTIDQTTLEIDDDDDSSTVGVSPTRTSIKDVNNDGFEDLNLKFATTELLGARLLADNNVLFITGESDSTPIVGSGIINLAGRPNCFD